MEQILINYSKLYSLNKGKLDDGSFVSWDSADYKKGFIIYQNGKPVSHGHFKPLIIQNINESGLTLRDIDYKIDFKLSKTECVKCGIMPLLK